MQRCSIGQITTEKALSVPKLKKLNLLPWAITYRNIPEIDASTKSLPEISMERITTFIRLWVVRACTWNKVICKRYIEVINRILFPDRQHLMNWLLKYTCDACRHTHKMEFIVKTTSKTFHERWRPWRQPCSKTQVRRRPLQCPLWWKKHDKACVGMVV